MSVQRIENDAGGVRSLLLDVPGGHLVAGDDAGVIRLWRLSADRAERTLDIEPSFYRVDAMDWAHDRRGLVAAGEGAIQGFTTNGERFGRWPIFDSEPQSLRVLDPRRALVATDRGLHLLDFGTGDILDEAPAGDRNTGIARVGERVFVTACDQGGSVLRVYRLDGDRLQPLEPPPIALEVDHLSAPAVLGDHVMVGAHRLDVFDLRDGRRLVGINPDGSKTQLRLGDGLLVERLWSGAVVLGERRLAAASPEGPLCVYDVSDGRIVVIDALPRPATALTADGGVWAAASRDWSIYVGWP